MKNVFLALSLTLFTGTVGLANYSSQNQPVKVEVEKDKKKKKKKKKSSCSSESSCCSPEKKDA